MPEPSVARLSRAGARGLSGTAGALFGGLFSAALTLGGCATYHPRPLDGAAVNAALVAPKLEAVRIAAQQLHHPLIPPIVIDGRGGFSPDEIAVMTVVTSPALRALRAQRGVARAQLLQAGLLPNPQLGATFDRVDARGDPTLVNGDSLGVSWDLTALLLRGDMAAAARATADALDLSIAWQEWQASQDARLRAYRLLSLQQQLPLAREVEVDLAAAADDTRRAVQQRLQAAPALVPAEDAWRRAHADRLALEQQILVDQSDLNLALGRPPDAPLTLRATDAPPAVPPETLAAAVHGLEENRLDLVALKLGYASQEATLRAAIKAQFPKINVSLARARDTSDVHTHSIGVTLDLPIFDHAQGQIAVARATRQQLFEEYVARVAEARSQVGQLLAQITSIRAELAAVDASLGTLEKVAAAFATAHAAHTVDAAAERDARDTLASRRIEQIQLQQSLLELGVGLETVIGHPLLNRRASAGFP